MTVPSRQRITEAGAVLLVVFSMLCGWVVLTLLWRVAVQAAIHVLGFPLALGLTLLAFLLVPLGLRLWRSAGIRALTRWAARNGWSVESGRSTWPWTATQPGPDSVTVNVAVSGKVRGFPITVGEVSWTHDGLGGTADRWKGRGVFAVVRLHRTYPATAVQRRRNVGRRRPGQDEFDRRYRILIDDLYFADQLTGPALRRAHAAKQIPPWSIAGDELFAITKGHGPLRPARVVSATEQVLRVVELLEIRPGSRSVRQGP